MSEERNPPRCRRARLVMPCARSTSSCFRDLQRLWAQALAIALVIAGGVATLILAVGSYRSLDETRAAYYERYRFADVFAMVKRAPKSPGRSDRGNPRRRRRRCAHRQARPARHPGLSASPRPGSSFRCRTAASPRSTGSTCASGRTPEPGAAGRGRRSTRALPRRTASASAPASRRS